MESTKKKEKKKKKKEKEKKQNKKKQRKSCFFFLFSFPLSDNINRKIYQSIHPKTSGASKFLSTFNCCGLSANLYIHWLKTQAIVYELLYFDVFLKAPTKGYGTWLYQFLIIAYLFTWQLLKDFKHDKEFHYVTIKSKTLTCHFNCSRTGL